MDHLGKYLLLALTIQGLVVDTCLACLPVCLYVQVHSCILCLLLLLPTSDDDYMWTAGLASCSLRLGSLDKRD